MREVCQVIGNNGILVETPDGMKSFTGMQRIYRDCYWHIITFSGLELKCSIKHPVKNESGNFVHASTLANGDRIQTKKGLDVVVYSEYVNEPAYLYDLFDVGQSSELFTNDIVSHNCEFLGSSNTLISPEVLRRLVFHPPVQQNSNLKVYLEPDQSRLYAMTVDVSRGLGGDFSAFVVWDITESPYKVAAVYRNNQISTLLFPEVVYSTCKRYNHCYALVEINDLGQQVVDILHEDLEYENILYTQKSPNGMTEVSQGFRQSSTKGLRTTKSTKKIGCSNFKTLVENDKVELMDMDLIAELYRFVAIGDTYKAEDGNDDLAMCGVLFGWLMTQQFIKEISNLDIRQRILLEKQRALDDEMLPFGMYDDGQPEPEVLPVTRDVLNQLLFPDDEVKARMEKYSQFVGNN
jgi:hypothetical protein